MDPPNKRLQQSPPGEKEAGADFVPLGGNDDADDQYGYGSTNGFQEQPEASISQAPRAPRAMYQHSHSRHAWNDPRNAKDKPKSKHTLPGHEPWVLIKTKFGRRFVHNTATQESFWRIPADIFRGVREFDAWEKEQGEKKQNAKWAEEQLQEMRDKSQAAKVNKAADDQERRTRRRRSESLQREDEDAMMAELAAEAEKKEEEDAREAVKGVEALQPKVATDGRASTGDGGYGSDSSYEEVEVTDSEFEDVENGQPQQAPAASGEAAVQSRDEGPVEFGEDDIAFQLAAMEQSYDDLDDAYEEEANEDNDEPEEPGLTEEDAVNLFRDMLDDHHISPFTPWESLIADQSENGILMDDRYTILPNTRTRKAVWETWVKDTAARLKEQRAQQEKQDPKIPYLEFLSEKATPKLYWPEFKRKFKKEAVMNERKLSEKDRERLYRDHVNRLKLPESTRKADLITLLKSIPFKELNRATSLDALAQIVRGHLHFISLPNSVRDEVLRKHISSLPPAPEGEEDGEVTTEQRAEDDRKRAERRRREDALAERQRKVDEERRKVEKEGRWAKRELREEENELRRAMEVGSGGLRGQLGDGR